MRPFALIAFIAFALPSSPDPTASFHYQRLVTPPTGAPAGPACVVLDATVFSHAEPGLRDLRLFQDGAELPFAIEESFDKRALEHDRTPPDDRSLYEVASREPAWDRAPLPAGISGLDNPLQNHAQAAYSNDFRLPPRVPVERIRLDPAPGTAEHISIIASPVGLSSQERIAGTLSPEQPTLPVTLGANLQTEAKVLVTINGASRPIRAVLLEMRRRSLCYQPRTASAPVLLLGNPALSAPQYDYARRFSTETPLPLATLGPLTANPAFRAPERSSVLRSRHAQWQIAVLVSGSLFLLSATHLLNQKKGPLR